jgi:hypothetical protein
VHTRNNSPLCCWLVTQTKMCMFHPTSSHELFDHSWQTASNYWLFHYLKVRLTACVSIQKGTLTLPRLLFPPLVRICPSFWFIFRRITKLITFCWVSSFSENCHRMSQAGLIYWGFYVVFAVFQPYHGKWATEMFGFECLGFPVGQTNLRMAKPEIFFFFKNGGNDEMV